MNKPYANNRIDYIVNLIEPSEKDKVLNIGISNIPEVEMAIENKVSECTTLDFDKNKISKAAKFLKKTKLIYGDITKNPIKLKNYYDKVVVVEVLEHLDDDYGALRWINSKMKKGGKIIIGVPNDAFLHYFNPVKYMEHKRHYSPEMARQLVESNGFKIEHFNIVERFTLLVNLYIHLFFKFILRKNIKFGTFTKLAEKSYTKNNIKGMDIIIKAVKK